MKLNGVGKRINLASLVLDTDKEKMDLGTYLPTSLQCCEVVRKLPDNNMKMV